jgi:hypothetical protein
MDASASKRTSSGFDDTALDNRIRQLLHSGVGNSAHVVGKLKHNRQRRTGKQRCPPQYVVAAWCYLFDLQHGGSYFMCARARNLPQHSLAAQIGYALCKPSRKLTGL